MENQGQNLLSDTNGFGIQTASAISNETADLIFGGGTPATDPSTIAPIKKKAEPKVAIAPLENEEDELVDPISNPKLQLSADDILGALDEEEDETEAKKRVSNKEDGIIDENEDSNVENSTFATLTKDLIKLGVFSEKEEDKTKPPTTAEEFKERWIAEKQEQSNSDIYNFLMSKHGEEGVELFNAIFVNGATPKEFLSKYEIIQSMQGMDLNNEDNQKKIFKEAYRRQGLSDDKIDKKLQKTIDYGDLEDEAKDLHEVLLRQDQQELEQIQTDAAEEQKSKQQQKAQYTNNLNTILSSKLKEKEFDGIPVTDKVARQAYDFLATEKWQLPNGDKLTDFDKTILELRDPKNHELKIKLGLLLMNGLDLSKVKAKAITTESNKVFDTLIKRDIQTRRTNKIVPTRSFVDGL